ncbi:dipeptidase [Micromonospora sp. NPDC048830]|uniref:dipeptidase n=1 Tax=Micromonospora sp. NPDC048830 TaxID=3364257 RepID=UPI0037239F0C
MNRPYQHLPWYQPPVAYADQHATRSSYSARVDRADGRLRRLLATAPAIGIHDHPFLLPANLDAENWGNWRREKRLEYAYEAMASSGVTAAVASTNSWHTAAEIETMLPRFLADLAHHDGFHLVSRFADLTAGIAPDGGLPTSVGVILGLESMTEFGHDLDAVERLFGLGVRVGGLIYSDGNLLGGGLSSAFDEGLTSQGRAVLRRMNEVGMVADFAHAGDRTTLDAIEASTVPIMISHAGSRSLWPTSRMKPDDLIKALADTGGIIGVEAPPNSTCVPGQEGHTIDHVMAHVERIVELVGVDAVALGLDVTFGPHHQLHMIRAAAPHGDVRPVDGLPRATYVDGLENPEEGFWNAGWWLIEHGYADEDIRKILGGNALRYFKTVMPG